MKITPPILRSAEKKFFWLILVQAIVFTAARTDSEGTDIRRDKDSVTAETEIDTSAVNLESSSFFQIAVLPDTRYCTDLKHGGTTEMFEQQIAWIENDRNGGNGLMRIMKIDLDNETPSVRTFAPRTGANILEENEDSMFTGPLYQQKSYTFL
ncbi:hypothetical protein [Sinomicrobium soli]|uniref:hypothetical protein n=1 Tax=Sinomicrobium sp. N-1-3-6 TaxID=2219864 RepID=UPI000DCB5FCF|nr:hypothetical protein [Sinomicrobium sp. N-1-3-6]RAV28403.1 hypothetical protein DN748_13545 [Sinomicrobium sp. N-1-3-6]